MTAIIIDCIGNPKIYQCTIYKNDTIVFYMNESTHTFKQICDTLDLMHIGKDNIIYRKEELIRWKI